MYRNIEFKDLEAISTSIDICSIGELYDVKVLTNSLEGNINAVVKIISKEAGTLGKFCLFSFRDGEQILLCGLGSEEQLIIPDDYFARLKESLSIRLNMFGNDGSIWEKTIIKLNKNHENDSNSNYQVIPTDLPIPEFKYEVVEKKEDKPDISSTTETSSKVSFFKRLFKKTKKNQENEAEDK